MSESSSVKEMAAQLKEMKSRQNLLRRFFQEVMVAGQDYGLIPGTDKPTLLKPGAEKLNELYGYAPAIKSIEETADRHTGFYRARVTVGLVRRSDGSLAAEGVGEANTAEGGRSGAAPWVMWNTVLKMAKKRALVDATLSATNASGLFTQDTEDLKAGMLNAGGGKAGGIKAGKRQLGLIKGRLSKAGINYQDAAAVKALLRRAGIAKEALEELTAKEVDVLIERLEGSMPAEK